MEWKEMLVIGGCVLAFFAMIIVGSDRNEQRSVEKLRIERNCPEVRR